MKASCEMFYWSTGCNQWFIHDNGYLESGDNKMYHSMKSVLEYKVEVTEPIGTLEIEYFVSSEAYFDYFAVTIDDLGAVLRESNTVPAVRWTPFAFNLTKGYHTIGFVFQKDASDTKGADVARIRSIKMSGISHVPLDCDPCQPGFFSDGTHACKPCPAGMFTDEPEQSVCQYCPSGQSSFEGSSTCFAMSTPCVATDFFAYHSLCDSNGLTSINYEWIEPQICNVSHPDSVALPPTQFDVPCSQLPTPVCNPGQEYNAATYECQYCDAGSHSKNGEKCSPCGVGSATEQKYITIEKFVTRDHDLYSKLISTGCTGECASNGWRTTEKFIDSGLGNGISQSWFDINVNAFTTKELKLQYALTCDVGGGALDIEVDGRLALSIPCSGCLPSPPTMSEAKVDLNPDAHVIRVNYRTMSLLNSDTFLCDRAVVSKIQLEVEESMIGGAAECETCSGGEYSDNGNMCAKCPAGTESKSSSTTCQDCKPGSFSYTGSDSCFECGNGMTSGAKAGKCDWEYGVCKYNGTLLGISRLFDFASLGRALLPATATSPVNPDVTFHFNICSEESPARSVRKIRNEVHPCVASGSFVCMKDKAGEVTSLGKSVSIETGLYDNRNDNGFHLKFIDYSAENCYNNVTGDEEHYQTIFNVKCNPEDSETQFFGPTITKEKPCVIKMDFSSKHACPLCTDDDYTALEATCNPKTGTKEIVYVKKTDVANRCYGGVSKPKETVSCSVNVVTAPYWIVGGVLGGAGLLIIVLAVAAVFFYLKFKDASQKFYQLQEGDNESTGREMQVN